jgi:hypothetical protein
MPEQPAGYAGGSKHLDRAVGREGAGSLECLFAHRGLRGPGGRCFEPPISLAWMCAGTMAVLVLLGIVFLVTGR